MLIPASNASMRGDASVNIIQYMRASLSIMSSVQCHPLRGAEMIESRQLIGYAASDAPAS